MFSLIPFRGTDGESGSAVRNDAYVCAIVLTFVRLFASLSLSKISQSLKRRTMYLVSAVLTVFSLLLIGFCIYSIQRYMISNEVIFNCQAKEFARELRFCKDARGKLGNARTKRAVTLGRRLMICLVVS